MTNTIQDTTISIFNISIHEPVTVLTDYLMALQCLFFYNKLKELSLLNKSTFAWRNFFVLMCVSAFTGGCSHAFFEIHKGLGYKTFWLAMQATNIISLYFLQKATLFSALDQSRFKTFWKTSYIIQLSIALIAVFVFQSFLVVIINTALGLVPAMVIYFRDAKQDKESLWVGYGIVVLVLTAAVNATKLTLHAYFNYLDLSHVLIMVNLWMMFKGAKNKGLAFQMI